MTFKKICFQLHWCIGISAGFFLILMGLSGAALSFQEEILDALNPGSISGAKGEGAVLTPAQLLQAIQVQLVTTPREVERLELHTFSGRNPLITFAALPGQSHGERVWAHAYTGQLQTMLIGSRFFDCMERLHIWLLLPTGIGQPLTGIFSACLLVLCLSGLYLRWPRRNVGSLKNWLHLRLALRGRPLLWSLHAVLGTWVLLVYLVLSVTGMYWGLTPLRSLVDGWAGIAPRTAAVATVAASIEPLVNPDTGTAAQSLPRPWSRFEQLASQAGGWQFVQIRLPRKAGQDYQFNWLGTGAPHAMARNRTRIGSDGQIKRDEPYANLSTARQALTSIYPLHVGSYFGLAGRIVMMLASLLVPLFAITGWMLYLDRRRKARSVMNSGPQSVATSVPGQIQQTVAVIYASQSGYARSLAESTAQRIRQSGHAVELLSAAKFGPLSLNNFATTLWVVSTFGEGDAPDDARRLLCVLQKIKMSCPGNHAVWALGDRRYTHFCSFGLKVQDALNQIGSIALFDAILQDGESALGWNRWCSALSQHGLVKEALPISEPDERAFSEYQLINRTYCNPQSPGAPLYRLELRAVHKTSAHWQAGAIAEVVIQTQAGQRSVNALHTTELERPRRYSIASLTEDGYIQLWVRQVQHDGRLGLMSGWLTQGMQPHGRIQLRLLANPKFSSIDTLEMPAIFIGSGSGYAGLRALLLDRIQSSQHQNWLIFGERDRQADEWAEAEVSPWKASGQLLHADFAYSRDAENPCYVQNLLDRNAERLRDWVTQGAVIYICGSYQGMGHDVEQTLKGLLEDEVFHDLQASGRYRRDVY